MIPVKVQCGCGQKYAFDVEPVNGRMPYAVACPVCNADGTMAANQIIAQTLGGQAGSAPAPTMLRPAAAPPPAVAPPPTTTVRPTAQDAIRRIAQGSETGGGSGENWKWWYFVLAGVLIGGYSIWQAYNSQSIKPLGELFFAVFCIVIGIWDFQRKRKQKRAKG